MMYKKFYFSMEITGWSAMIILTNKFRYSYHQKIIVHLSRIFMLKVYGFIFCQGNLILKLWPYLLFFNVWNLTSPKSW